MSLCDQFIFPVIPEIRTKLLAVVRSPPEALQLVACRSQCISSSLTPMLWQAPLLHPQAALLVPLSEDSFSKICEYAIPSQESGVCLNVTPSENTSLFPILPLPIPTPAPYYLKYLCVCLLICLLALSHFRPPESGDLVLFTHGSSAPRTVLDDVWHLLYKCLSNTSGNPTEEFPRFLKTV